jgi:hypothetical protein
MELKENSSRYPLQKVIDNNRKKAGLKEAVIIDGFVKSPHAALCRILRHCSVRQVRFIPQDLHALPANFLRRHHHWYVFEIFRLTIL